LTLRIRSEGAERSTESDAKKSGQFRSGAFLIPLIT
jgi:hypothetical protein